MKFFRSLPHVTKKSIEQICADSAKHELETVRLNFEMGDLLNSYVAESGLTTKEAALIFEKESHIGWTRFYTNSRIARRVNYEKRPKNVPWGVIQYMVSELNPKTFGVPEIEFCNAAIKALKELEDEKVELIDLKKKNGEFTLGELKIKRYITRL